jgi:SAM-dependent methyltransferase
MERWIEGGLYESYVGRWSRPVAAAFVERLGVPAGATWVDVGTGTGALAEAALREAAAGLVIGVEPSDGFRRVARERLDGMAFEGRAGDAGDLPVDPSSAEAVVSGLVLNFVPDRAAALAEARRIAKPGAVVAAYVWDYAGEMQLMRAFWDAAVELDPRARGHDEGVRFADLATAEGMSETFASAGLDAVVSWPIDVPTVFRDFDDYWTPFLSGQAPAPSYCMSLDEEHRSALRERLRATLPAAPDGTISLVARAWAAMGREPG